MRDFDPGIYGRRPDTLQQRLAVLGAALTPPAGQEDKPTYHWHRLLSEGLSSAMAQAQQVSGEWAHVVQFEACSLADPDMPEAFRTLGMSLGVWGDEADLATYAHTITELRARVPKDEVTNYLLSGTVPLVPYDEQGVETGLVLPTQTPGVWLELKGAGVTTGSLQEPVQPMLYVYVGDGLASSE